MKMFSSRVNEARKAVKFIEKFDSLVPKIEVYKFKDRLPRAKYRTKPKVQYGIDKEWLKKWIFPDTWDSEGIIIHDPKFKIEGANGWHTQINGYPVIQVFKTQDRPHHRMDMTDLERLLLHEIGHFLYKKYGIKDRTHYWDYDKWDFRGMFDEIRNAQPSMLERWLVALSNTINPREEVYDIPWTLHHTGGENHTLDGLLNSNTYKDRPVFYNVIIDKEGNVHHFHDKLNPRGRGWDYNVAVLGDYTKETPTQAVKDTLKDFLKGKDWATHKELAEVGLATKSQCPGNIIDYV